MKTIQLTEEQTKKLSGFLDFAAELKQAFGNLVPKEKPSGVITDRVRTYEDACRELGRQPFDEEQLAKLGLTPNDIAYQKLAVVVEALNEGWKPNVCNSDIIRYNPWFRPNGSPSSFAFGGSFWDDVFADAGSGSRLALKSEDLANYCGIQFIELWKEFIL